MRERDLDRLFVAACKKRGIVTYKTSSYGARGFPDRTLVGPGRRVGFVELKGSDGALTVHQRQCLYLLAKSNAFVREIKAHPHLREMTLLAIRLCLDQYMESEQKEVRTLPNCPSCGDDGYVRCGVCEAAIKR
jgi:hypothetical protein